MRAVITRVKSASVSIAGSVVGEIGHGLLILLGVGPDDTPELCEKLADKALGLRIFCDEAGKMNRSLADIGGQVLVVSQFTLYADCRKGKRPSFTGAALPELAVPLYEQFLQECRSRGFAPQHGQFGADMLVASENDGPVTILLDTDELLQPRRADPGKPQTPLPTDDCRERRPRRPVGHPANFRPLCRPHALPNLTVAALSERLAGWKVIGRHRRPYPPCRGGALPTGTGCR